MINPAIFLASKELSIKGDFGIIVLQLLKSVGPKSSYNFSRGIKSLFMFAMSESNIDNNFIDSDLLSWFICSLFFAKVLNSCKFIS